MTTAPTRRRPCRCERHALDGDAARAGAVAVALTARQAALRDFPAVSSDSIGQPTPTPPTPPDPPVLLPYPDLILSRGPLAYYRLGEAPGSGNAADSSGNFHPVAAGDQPPATEGAGLGEDRLNRGRRW